MQSTSRALPLPQKTPRSSRKTYYYRASRDNQTKQITSSRSTSKQITRWLSVNITIQNTFSTTMPHKLNIKTQISFNRKTIYIIKFKIYPPLYLNTHMYVFIPFCMLTHITINYFSQRQELIMTFTLDFCIELLLLLSSSSSTTQYHNKET